MKPQIVTKESVAADGGAGTLRILLVEDNPVNQRVEMTLLIKEGYEVDLAQDGGEALVAVEHKDYDLILMDIQMPVMDGLAATAAIRGIEAKTGRRRVPIIAVTARAMKGDKDQCLRAGMDDYITKPVGRGELEKMIEKWRPKAPAGTGNAAPASRSQRRRASALLRAVGPKEGHKAIVERFRELGMLEDPEVLREMMDTFLADASRLASGLKGAITARDTGSSQTLAHSLKGISLNVGAARLAELAMTLEEQIKAVDLSEASTVLDALLRELDEVRAFAESFVKAALEQRS